jgi:hypothetical protein
VQLAAANADAVYVIDMVPPPPPTILLSPNDISAVSVARDDVSATTAATAANDASSSYRAAAAALLLEILGDPAITKLGFGWSNDWRRLRQALNSHAVQTLKPLPEVGLYTS